MIRTPHATVSIYGHDYKVRFVQNRVQFIPAEGSPKLPSTEKGLVRRYYGEEVAARIQAIDEARPCR